MFGDPKERIDVPGGYVNPSVASEASLSPSELTEEDLAQLRARLSASEGLRGLEGLFEGTLGL